MYHLELSCRPFVFHSAIGWSILILLDRSFRMVKKIYSGVRCHLPCLDTTKKKQWTTGGVYRESGVGEGIDEKRREKKKNLHKSERSRVGQSVSCLLVGLKVSKEGKTVSREKNWRSFGSRQIRCLHSGETVDWSVVYS